MRTRHIQSSVLLIALVLGLSRPAFADPIDARAVTQVFTDIHSAPELQLRNFSNYAMPLDDVGKLGAPESTHAASGLLESTDVSGSVLSGVEFTTLTQQQDPAKAPQGDVEAAICDCGDLTMLVGGFPKWPFLFLAGIPLFFINKDNPVPPLTPLPTPTPPPPAPNPPVPEPTSILLLLTGLGAVGFRVRKRLEKK